MVPRGLIHDHGRGLAAVALLAALGAWLYGPMLAALVRQWSDEPDYSHGFLIPVVAAYLVWQRWPRLRAMPVAPAAAGLAVLIVGVALFVLAHMAAELFVMRASLVVVLAGLVLYLRGAGQLRLLAFPLVYLLLMVPPPAIVVNAITFPLQLFAAGAATTTLQLLDVPVLREGNIITLANTKLEVAEACSGVRSLLALVAMATTYAYFTQPTLWRRALVVLSAVPIAILANAARVAGTGLLAHRFGDTVAQGFFHSFSGWLVFVAALLLLCLEGFVLDRISCIVVTLHTRRSQACARG
jgi:exosortase